MKSLKSLEGHIQKKDISLAASQAQVELLSNEVKNKDLVLSDYQQAMTQKLVKLQELVGVKDNELEHLKSETKRVQDEFDHFKVNSTEKERHLQEELQTYQSEAQKQLKEITSQLQLKATALHNMEMKGQEESLRHKNEMSLLEQQMKNYLMEIERLKKSLEENEMRLKSSTESGERERQREKENYEKVEKEMKQQLNEKDSEMEHSKGEIKRLESLVKSREEERDQSLEAKQLEIQQLKSDAAGLNDQIKKEQNVNSSLQENITQLQV
jgi:chromosome segregation ATPase